MRARRRSGIANLIGAVFFILIVVLMVGALAAMFGTFSSSIGGQHTNDVATQQQQDASMNVQNVTYGGLTSYNGFNYAATGSVNLALNTKEHPILPITNMNFTGGVQGWTASHSYHLVSDAATVQLACGAYLSKSYCPQYITYNNTYPSSTGASPTTLGFDLNVINNNPLGSQYNIAKVSLLVDQEWGVPAVQPVTLNWGSTPLATSAPSVVGNNVTWVALLPSDIQAGGNQPFQVTLNVPRTYGTFNDTVIVSWLKNFAGPFTDSGIATVNSTVTSAEVSNSGTLGTSSANINPAPAGAASSGLTAGYDANALTTSSESGPGSLYLDFSPSFNSAPITDGQQLSATTDFTTAFSLDYKTVSAIPTSGCCTLSWESSLDSVSAPRNSLIVYQAYLTNPNGLSSSLPIGGTSCGASPTPLGYVNPTAENEFGPTGWVFDHVCFNPSSSLPAWLNGSVWYTGQYTLSIAVTVTVPGALPLTTGYPPQVSIHLDDIGLALTQKPATYYGQTTFEIPTGLIPSQVQGLELGINASGANQNTTMHAYVADNSHLIYNPSFWVQIGSASFINSATIDSVSGLPNAAYYLNSTTLMTGAKHDDGFLTVSVNATSSVATAPYTVKLAVWAVIQTFNQTRMVVELQNTGPTTIKLLSMVITGPGNATRSNFATNFYFSPGQKLVLPETFWWIPGSTYTVTVTTASGLTFSRSFAAPLN